MEAVTINPYPSFTSDIKGGLDAIIATPPTKVSDLNTALVAFIQSLFNYPAGEALDDVELNSYLPIAINAYTNNEINVISKGQAPFVVLLLKKIKDVPPLQILDYLAGVEEQIAESGLSMPEQNQLFMATAVAAACYTYWLNQINIGQTGPWAPYLNANAAVNIATLPYWVAAAIQAALYFCFKGNYVTDSKEPPKISGPSYVTVLTASIGISAGKIIFNWTPKVKSAVINGSLGCIVRRKNFGNGQNQRVVGGRQDGGNSYLDQTPVGQPYGEPDCDQLWATNDPVGWIDHIYEM